MTNQNDLIMIVGGGIFQVPSIEEAQKMGYKVLVIDFDPKSPGALLSDYFEVVSTKDINAAIGVAKKYALNHNLKAVFTAGTDVAYTVASVAEALGLHGVGREVALNATNKYCMRQQLQKHAVPCPKFFSTSNVEEACMQAELLGYPLVIKPVDNMGARGVRQINSEEELRNQFDLSIGNSGHYSSEAVIIEEYMSGPEISMDTLVDQNGDVYMLTVADRHIERLPYFVETGHSIPSQLPQAAIDDALNVMKQAIKAIGIQGSAAKADIKITPDGAKIGEVTARLSGGFHSQYTDPLATGMHSTRAALKLALGESLDLSDITPVYDRVSIERAIIPSPGEIVDIAGLEEASRIDGIFDIFMTSMVGDTIKDLRSNIGKAGHIIAFGETREAAEFAYLKALSCIKIETRELQSC